MEGYSQGLQGQWHIVFPVVNARGKNSNEGYDLEDGQEQHLLVDNCKDWVCSLHLDMHDIHIKEQGKKGSSVANSQRSPTSANVVKNR